MVKRIFVIFALFLVIPISYASSENEQRFNLFGIDWKALWEKISFWNRNGEDEVVEKKDTVSQTPKTSSSSSPSQPREPSPPKPPVTFNFAGTKYTQDDMRSAINNDERFKGYLKGLGYDCIAVTIIDGDDFTMTIDTNTGELKSVRKGVNCDQHVKIDESLILDIQAEGFKVMSVRSYLNRIEMPRMMYLRALKAVTIG